MHKKLLILLSVILLLTACWSDEEEEKTKKETNKAAISQTAINNKNIPLNTNPEKKDSKDLIVNPKLNDDDKERIETIKNRDDNFYLFSNENYEESISIMKERLKVLDSGVVYKINPETNKEYIEEEYKKSRLLLVKFTHPETWKENNEKQIDTEIFLANHSIKTNTVENYSTYLDDDWEERKYKASTSAKLLKESNKEKGELVKKLLTEKKALEEWNFKSYITLTEEEIKWEIKSINNRLDNYKIEQLEWDSILSIVEEYKNGVSKGDSVYNPEEVKYIFEKILDRNIELKNVNEITLLEAKSILSQFESGKLVKLTKKLPSWMNISSDILYAKIKDKDWNEYYIDETLYTKIKHSVKVWWDNFLLYEDPANSWFQNKIYSFLTWYNPNQSYYQSLSNLILNKWNIEIHKVLFTTSIDKKTENGLSYNSYSWNIEVDVNKNWMLTNLLLILTGEEESSNDKVSTSQLKDFLTKLF